MDILFTLLTSYFLSLFLFPVQISLQRKNKLFDTPGRRKIHKELTPSMGGITIAISVFISILFWVPYVYFENYREIFYASTLLLLIGLRDDITSLRPFIKLFGQILAALIIIIFLDSRLHSFYEFNKTEIPIVWSYLFTIITIIAITNSFNLIDGVDGLAGLIAINVLTFYSLWFYSVNQLGILYITIPFIGAILAFLSFNWHPAKIFMGDTGALLIGFFIAVITIYFLNINFGLPPTNKFKFYNSIATVFCLLIIPFSDTIRVIINRLVRKKSPFKPDKTHIHHLLLRLGFNHAKVSTLLSSINLFFILIALFYKNIPNWIFISSFLILSLILSTIIDVLINFKLKRKIVWNDNFFITRYFKKIFNPTDHS